MGPQPATARATTAIPVTTMLDMFATKIRSIRKCRRRRAEGTELMPASGRVSAMMAMAPEA